VPEIYVICYGVLPLSASDKLMRLLRLHATRDWSRNDQTLFMIESFAEGKLDKSGKENWINPTSSVTDG
jgi:hypothetical protein